MPGEGKHADDAAGRVAEEARANFDSANQPFMAALEKLKEQPATNPEHIAAIGVAVGGDLALNMARAGVDLDGVISFYASLAPPVDGNAQKGGVKASLLVLNGADDAAVSSERRRAFREEMDAAGADYEFINYPGAAHGFANPDIDKQAWQQVRTFLARVFR
jgi:dienelactone hydrolase